MKNISGILNSFLLVSTVSLVGQDLTWVNPTGIDVRTVFYQGMNSSQTQAAKYTGPDGFIATTGELVVNKNGIHTIQNVHVAPEIDEVTPAPRRSLQWSDLTLNPMSMINGLGKRLCYFAVQRSNASYGTQILPTADQDPDYTIASHSLDLAKINIAQDGDINNHKKRFDCCVKKHPESDIIAYGVSRGAATTFQSLATLAKEGRGHDISKIKLCILEGCFDDIPTVMRKRHPRFFDSDWALQSAATVASKVISYQIDGPSPIREVEHFPRTVPIAFITSKVDPEVPAECTKNLAQALYDAGHPSVHLLTLEKSSHPRYMFDDKDDASKYQCFVHALYEKYGLPHIATYAQRGRALVEPYNSLHY